MKSPSLSLSFITLLTGCFVLMKLQGEELSWFVALSPIIFFALSHACLAIFFRVKRFLKEITEVI